MRCVAWWQRSRIGSLWGLLLATLVTLASWPALAQTDADVSASLSTDRVEVGDSFTVELTAMSEGDTSFSSPALRVPAGMQAMGPRVSTRSMAHFGGGQSMIQKGIGATWQVVASKEGTFSIPLPTVLVDGRQVTARGQLTIRVVPLGSMPHSRRSPFPFPGLGGGFNFPFPSLQDPFATEPDEPDDISPQAKELALKREPDPYVFVRLMTDKERAVVGEQITLSYYVYYRTDLQLTVQREPPLTDFLRVEMDKAPGTSDALLTNVGGMRYHVKLLDKVALFPVRAGKLSTGVLFSKFRGRAFGNRELERTSNEVEIDVREPPLDGRPVGYRLGDVGHFSLSAKVAPQETTAGETVSVLVRLTGEGNLPGSLKIPERTGVEWLDPEKNDEIDIQRGKVSGWRTFGYAVRLTTPGEVDLGAIELPYYDADRGQYDVAKVDLGKVTVRAGAAGSGGAAPSAPENEDPFATVAEPRTSLGEYQAAQDEGLAPATFWTLLLVPPLGVGFAGGALSLARRWRRRRRSQQTDPATLARRALSDLDAKSDPKDAAVVAERAVHLAVQAATGLKSRAILLDDLAASLTAGGLGSDQADEVVSLLRACSTVRFDPNPDEEAASSVIARAKPLVRALTKMRPASALKSAAIVLSLLMAMVGAGLGAPARAYAADQPLDHFALGTAALQEGKFDQAIDHFEAHADREPSHPDVSFNRGLAYLMRVRAGAERPGDLGRAAAGFAETLAMRPGDVEAEHALELVHGEVARRRARRGKDAVLARPTLDRVVLRLASERAWGIAAVVASLLLAVGLVLRRRPAGPVHLAGVLLTPACAVAVLVLSPLYLGARHLRLNTEAGVLVVHDAHLTDAEGVGQPGEALPEAALVEVSDHKGRSLHVRYGSAEGWLPAAAVRMLQTR